MARRYESVATSRRPSADAASNTPVKIGLASSRDAAGTTWRSASVSAPAATFTPAPDGSVKRGSPPPTVCAMPSGTDLPRPAPRRR